MYQRVLRNVTTRLVVDLQLVVKARHIFNSVVRRIASQEKKNLRSECNLEQLNPKAEVNETFDWFLKGVSF